MKILVTIMLVVLSTASVLTADTLTITSHTVTDLCSSEKKWLISVSLGEIFFSDSLMSFDIAIDYDPAMIHPTDGLVQGTLAEFMKYGEFSPFFNFRVPGRMIAGAFTINTPVKGNRPFIAVTGNFVDTCGTMDSLFFPYIAEFNSEFKRSVTVEKSAIVKSVRVPRFSEVDGCEFVSDTIRTRGVDSTVSAELELQLVNNQSGIFFVSFQSPAESFFIVDSVWSLDGLVRIDSVNRNMENSIQSVYCSGQKAQNAVLIYRVRSNVASNETSTLEAQVNYLDSCNCYKPGVHGSVVVVNVKESLVSVLEISDDGFDLRFVGNEIQVQNHHGQSGKASLISIMGTILAEIEVEPYSKVRMMTSEVPSGLYLAVVTVGENRIVKKILK